MEKTRINMATAFFYAIREMWNSKEEIEEEIEGQQEELIGKLEPGKALELNKSLKRVSNMAGKLSLEKEKNDFKSSNKVKKGQMKKSSIVQNIEKVNEEKEIVE